MNTASDNVIAEVIAKYKETAAKEATIGVPLEQRLPYPAAANKAYKEASVKAASVKASREVNVLTKRPPRTTYK